MSKNNFLYKVVVEFIHFSHKISFSNWQLSLSIGAFSHASFVTSRRLETQWFEIAGTIDVNTLHLAGESTPKVH